MAFKQKVPSLKEEYRKNVFNECHTEDDVNYEMNDFSHYNSAISQGETPVWSAWFWDTFFRLHIGKTDDINVPMCSHDATINRETPEHYCRVCHKDLSVVKARVNDYLVLRHPQCTKPICMDCAKNNPDEFYKAFERGTTTAINAAHELYKTCNTPEAIEFAKEKRKKQFEARRNRVH